MCEKTEDSYLDGEVVWVKLGSCWWPGEVVGPEKLPPDVLPSFKKQPIAVVKFFQEDTYEYVKNASYIFKYDCSRKNEFINKGLYMYRTKHGPMDKFPEDVIRAETAIGGDIDILTRDEFQEKKKESYAGIFGDPRRTPGSGKKGKGVQGRSAEPARLSTPIRKVKEKVDYKVHILVQGTKTPNSDNPPIESTSTLSTSAEPGSDDKNEIAQEKDEKEKQENVDKPIPTLSTPAASSSGLISCHACSFTTTRLNVLILHNKTHSVSFTPYTPSPIRKKLTTKLSTKATPETSKTPKARRPRKEKMEKDIKKTTQSNKKRAADGEANIAETKKIKTNEEIKSSLLADWDDGDEESNDESSTMVMAGSPEVPEATESPAVPTSAELSSVQIPSELSSPIEKKSNGSPASEKPESSSDSKYEFCEDEDWPLEADGGRKIPRVKNPKRKEDTKSVSLDEDEVAREVAELLNRTTMPDLPTAPEPLKVEENFPEPSIVKSPDKREKSPEKSENPPEIQPTKAIFKTKTFFRSRHSRSQDAIGKYVAEQLNANAVDRMDISENEINGSEAVSSPEARESPPIEHVKVARLAPKIQLKKMKAELREKEKSNYEHFGDIPDFRQFSDLAVPQLITSPAIKQNSDKILQDVLYPTQEIKPVNADLSDLIKVSANRAQTIPYDTNKAETREAITNVTENIPDTLNKSVSEEADSNVEYSPMKLGHIAEKGNIIKNMEDGASIVENMEILVNSTENIEDATNNTRYMEDSSNITENVEYSRDNVENTKDTTIITENEEEMQITTESLEYGENIEDSENKSENIEDTVMKEVVNEKMDVIVDKKIEVTNELTDLENSVPVVKFSQTKLQTSFEPYMNESTASAVDALLSVSREADRVTRVISDDPPEDLFEDDNKDNGGTCSEVNGVNESMNIKNNVVVEEAPEPVKYLEDTDEVNHNQNEINTNESCELKVDRVSITEVRNVMNPDEMNILVNNQPGIVDNVAKTVIENIPSESDLQIAETLINLPSTAIQNKPSSNLLTEKINLLITEDIIQEEVIHEPESMVLEEPAEEITVEPEPQIHQSKSVLISNNENVIRFETEQEKSENLNAAQSLVQMSESIDHKINIDHNLPCSINNNKEITDKGVFNIKQNNGLDNMNTVEQKIASICNDNIDNTNGTKSTKMDCSSSKLLKILEEPCTPKFSTHKHASTKQSQQITGKEKILNFDVAKSFKGKSESPKQKIIIRRTTPSKNIINNMSDVSTPEKIILSRSNNPAQDGSVQTYTIQTSPEVQSDANTIIIQQKIRKIAKPPTKLQKIKPATSLIPPLNETSKIINESAADDAMFDINSMPIVLSEDLLTPESIEKMPIVMSDGNIITHTPNPPKLVKTKQAVENEKVVISATPSKPELKTLLMNPVTETKVSTPNILSKSSKLRGAKPMLVIDKTTGKQKIIMTKGETSVKEIKQTPTLIQSVPQSTGKSEKFIILPTPNSPRPGRTQKIVIDPQTGKAHVLVAKGSEPQLSSTDNKPISAKLIPSSTETSTPGNTVMIITNAQGAQSRIVLTPEHEKMLFPKKQQPNVSQLKTIAHRISTNPGVAQKTNTHFTTIVPGKTQNVGPVKTQTRLVPKQKSAIITSKGQLILGGRVASTAQNIAPMPEIRSVPKRIMASEPKKLVQTIQKSSSEPLIFLQQKSGAVMQLTAAQFEHLQRTGQIVQKTTTPVQENKVLLQKTITITPNESGVSTVHKPRVRKTVTESPTPMKKLKQEIPIAPAPSIVAPMPALTSFSNITPSIVPSVSNTVSVATTNYPEFDNFEELLPSTAIVKQHQEPVVSTVAQPEPQQPVEPPPAPLSEQLLAVPGEHFGGPPGSFYLCIGDNGTLTPVDNRPLVLDDNQLVPMNQEPPLPVLAAQPERRDILEAALANSDVFHADTARDDAPDFRDLNASVSVHCRVSETSTTLNQPIMTPVEVPSKADSEPAVPSNLEDGLAVIGVTPPTIPTSLELPITVTDPRIAPVKTTDPLSNNNYGSRSALLPSPNTELAYMTSEETDMPMGGPISMPLLTEEESVGKSMPILTDDITERTVSSVDSTVGSPSSIDVRESENEEGSQWTRRLLTPGSDTSEASTEIPLQPVIQLSVNELSRHS